MNKMLLVRNKVKGGCHRVHKHVFYYAFSAHLLHTTIMSGHIASFDGFIAFAASFGTVMLHVVDEVNKDE